MSRRNRGREPDWLEVVPAIAGFLVLAYIFVPGFRALVSGIFFLMMVTAGVTLVGFISWAIYSHYHHKPEYEYVPSAVHYAENAAPPTASAAIPNIGVRPRPYSPEVERLSEQRPVIFSLELLNALEWRRFEQLVTWYFHKTGFAAKRSRVGADGGVDILLTRPSETTPFAYVQCKAWHVYNVGVKPVRELLGVMAANRISAGYFVTTGNFTAEAVEFAVGQSLKLVTGKYLLEKLNSLSESDRSELLRDATLGDYTTPTCPRCDVKMMVRHGKNGDFWGCPNFRLRRPRQCRQTFKLRDAGGVVG
jgi:hypothetical protein